jgi:hypothetical protein
MQLSTSAYASVGYPLPGRGLSFLVRVKVMKTALSRGERVDRCRRFHQPERDG